MEAQLKGEQSILWEGLQPSGLQDKLSYIGRNYKATEKFIVHKTTSNNADALKNRILWLAQFGPLYRALSEFR